MRKERGGEPEMEKRKKKSQRLRSKLTGVSVCEIAKKHCPSADMTEAPRS